MIQKPENTESSRLTDKLLDDAARRGRRYLGTIDHRAVAPSQRALEQLKLFDEPFAEEPTDPMKVLAQLDELGSPATMAMAGRRFFGFVIGGSLPVTVASGWLATAWDQNTGLFTATPGTATLEQVALRWLLEIFGFPASCEGSFVTGATMANFTALAAARNEVLHKVSWDVESNGLFGAPPLTVIISEEAHPTLIKAIGMLGLGRDRVLRVAVDEQGRVRPDALPKISGPSIVCIQAGNINTGAFDPALEIITKAHESGAWVHVDGAFGLWAAVSPQRAHLMKGFEQADSWATDAHKWLNVPYDSGLAFVRDAEALRRAMALTAAYLPVTEHREPSQYTPELSRRARGVEVWAALRSLGRKGLAEMIERTCRHAGRFAEGLQAAGYSVLNEVVINQVLVSFGDPSVTNDIIKAVQEDGTCWCGGTVWQGKTAMRISVSSWATTEEDVEKSLDAIVRIAHQRTKRDRLPF
jgi:glutamate/tyrosine decarboxylase-like PLP-dependent enzyme